MGPVAVVFLSSINYTSDVSGEHYWNPVQGIRIPAKKADVESKSNGVEVLAMPLVLCCETVERHTEPGVVAVTASYPSWVSVEGSR